MDSDTVDGMEFVIDFIGTLRTKLASFESRLLTAMSREADEIFVKGRAHTCREVLMMV